MTVLFGLLGLLFGGLQGLVIGALAGYLVGWGGRKFLGERVRNVQTEFLDATFAVAGALCKADGVVTRDEIAAAEALFDRLQLSGEQRDRAKAAFTRGKSPDFDLDAQVVRLARASHGQRALLLMFVQIQCVAVAADGQVHPAEHAMLIRIATRLGLTADDLAQIEALLRTASAAPHDRLADAYVALGLAATASDAEVKQTYRRLMSQNHPDKLAGKGLPESMRQMAEERTREISTAYALIKDARGFN